MSSMRASNSASAAPTAPSASATRSPTPRWAAMAASGAAGSFWSRIAFEAAVRSARRVSTAWIASRRRRSASRSASTCASSTPTFARSAFTRAVSARISRMSSTALPHRVEGTAHVLERRGLAIEAHADHVEPDVGLGEPTRGEEVARHQREPRLLARVDRFARGAHGLTATAAHLDEDHGAPVERHEVDLTGAASEVALHDRVPASAEQLLRQRFTAPPELPPPVHGAGDYSAAGGLATRARHHVATRSTVARVANPAAVR